MHTCSHDCLCSVCYLLLFWTCKPNATIYYACWSRATYCAIFSVMAVMLPAQCIRVYGRLFGANRALASSAYVARRQKHTLPDLPYDYNALEPHISTEIMKLHHSKHHQTYVNNLVVAEEKMAEAAATGAHTHTCTRIRVTSRSHHANTACQFPLIAYALITHT